MTIDPELVTSSEDPRLRPFFELREHRGDRSSVIVEGELSVRRLLESEHPAQSVLATPNHAERLAPLMRDETLLLVADKRLMSQVLGFEFHRGCLACAPRPLAGDATARQQIERIRDRRRVVVLCLIGLADPVNVGTIIRSARAFAVDMVVCDERGADPFSARAIRASMGNVFCVPVIVTTRPERFLSSMRERLAAKVIASSVRAGALALESTEWPARAVVLIGNEGRGLAPELLDAADIEVTISIEPAADSLNVAAATAILLQRSYRVQNER